MAINISFTEDHRLSLATGTLPNSLLNYLGAGATKLVLSVVDGTFRVPGSSGGVAVSGVGTSTLTLTGATNAELTAWLSVVDRVGYLSSPNGLLGDDILTHSSFSGAVPVITPTQVAMTLVPSNDAPVVDAGGLSDAAGNNDYAVSYHPLGDPLKLVADDFVITDVDLTAEYLTVARITLSGVNIGDTEHLTSTLDMVADSYTYKGTLGDIAISSDTSDVDVSSHAIKYVTLNGLGTLADYEAAIATLRYQNDTDVLDQNSNVRYVHISVTDVYGLQSNTASFTSNTSILYNSLPVPLGARIHVNGVDSGEVLVAVSADNKHFLAGGPLTSMPSDGSQVNITFVNESGSTIATIPPQSSYYFGGAVTTIAIDWLPAVDLGGSNTSSGDIAVDFNEGGTAVALADSSNANLMPYYSYLSGVNVKSLTVTLTNTPDGTSESLAYDGPFDVGYDVAFDADKHSITFTGTVEAEGFDPSVLSMYLDHITYLNTESQDNIDQTDRVVNFVGTSLGDVDGPTTQAIIHIKIPPVTTADVSEGDMVTGPLNYTEPVPPDTYTFVLDGTDIAGLTIYTDGAFSFDAGDSAYDHLSEGATTDVVATFTVTDSASGTGSGTLTITVTGVNDAPSGTDATNDATEGSSATGTLTSSGDNDDNHSASYVLDGTVAGLTIATDGSYSFDASDSAYDHLSAGATTDVVATFTVTDDQSATGSGTLTITVTGVNDDPSATDATNSVKEGRSVSGSLTSSDVDDNHSASYALDGTLDGLTIATGGSYRFNASDSAYDHLSQGETEDVVATFTVTDDQSATDSGTLTITVTGVNDAPEFSSLKKDSLYGQIDEGESGDVGTAVHSVSGRIHFTDPDTANRPVVSVSKWDVSGYDVQHSSFSSGEDRVVGGDALKEMYDSIVQGFTVTPSLNNGNDGVITWNLTVDQSHLDYLKAGDKVEATFTLAVTDGLKTDHEDVHVTIYGHDDAYTFTESVNFWNKGREALGTPDVGAAIAPGDPVESVNLERAGSIGNGLIEFRNMHISDNVRYTDQQVEPGSSDANREHEHVQYVEYEVWKLPGAGSDINSIQLEFAAETVAGKSPEWVDILGEDSCGWGVDTSSSEATNADAGRLTVVAVNHTTPGDFDITTADYLNALDYLAYVNNQPPLDNLTPYDYFNFIHQLSLDDLAGYLQNHLAPGDYVTVGDYESSIKFLGYVNSLSSEDYAQFVNSAPPFTEKQVGVLVPQDYLADISYHKTLGDFNLTVKDYENALDYMDHKALDSGSVLLGVIRTIYQGDDVPVVLTGGEYGVDNVAIPLTEAGTLDTKVDSAVTDEKGEATFEDISQGVHVLSADRLGDNIPAGTVTAIDVWAAQRIATGLDPNGSLSEDHSSHHHYSSEGDGLNAYQLFAADVNGDGEVNSRDISIIQQMALHNPSSKYQGGWVFVNGSVPQDELGNQDEINQDAILASTNNDSSPVAFYLHEETDLQLVGVVLGDVNGSWMAPVSQAG